MTIWDTVEEPLYAHIDVARKLVAGHREAALKRVGLASHDGRTKVGLLSAFDKRRLQIARAIVVAPFLVIVDEPLRRLDAFAQAIVLELLSDLRRLDGPALLVVTADMRIAYALADDLMVFKDTKPVERGPILEVMRAPKHGETKRLLTAAFPLYRIGGAAERPARPADTVRRSEPIGAKPGEIAAIGASG